MFNEKVRFLAMYVDFEGVVSRRIQPGEPLSFTFMSRIDASFVLVPAICSSLQSFYISSSDNINHPVVKSNGRGNKNFSDGNRHVSIVSKPFSCLHEKYSSLSKWFSCLNRVYSSLSKGCSYLSKRFSSMNKWFSCLSERFSKSKFKFCALSRGFPGDAGIFSWMRCYG